jgi:EmrB/QacA subfamily drug resistance transporter
MTMAIMATREMTTAGPPALSYSSVPGRWVVAITVLGSGITALDGTAVDIALPAIGREFRVGVGDLQWVVSAYALTLVAFLLIGGSLGDRFGRRRVFLTGVVWFALASAACGFAPGAALLIMTRALQGAGAALLAPGSLAILEASFARADRGRAIGAWSGLSAIAVAAGPLIGGTLISVSSWRWIFFLNAPIALAVVALGARHVPESRDPGATGKIDYAGAASAVMLLTGVTFALIEAPALGWTSPGVLAMAAAAAAGLAALVLREHAAAAPMLQPGIFRVRQFAATNAVTFAVYGALAVATFLLPVQLQVGSGYSPLASGLALLPLTLIMLVLSVRSGRLAARIGPRLQMTVGPIVTGSGLALLTSVTSGSGYVLHVLPAVVVLAVGLAITEAPLTATAMNSVAAQHSGIASAVNNDVARFGGLLAVAALPPLAGISGTVYLHAGALAAGFRTVVLIAGAVCAAGGLLAAVTIANPPRVPRRAEEPPAVECVHCALDAPPLRVTALPARRRAGYGIGRPAPARGQPEKRLRSASTSAGASPSEANHPSLTRSSRRPASAKSSSVRPGSSRRARPIRSATE